MGTRPEAIKLCPVIRELHSRKDQFAVTVCATGQHKSMMQDVMEAFSVEADMALDVMRSGQSLSGLASRLLVGCDELLVRMRPDMVVVQGDTSSAFAGALAAFYRGIPVVHIEAGLRTNSIRDPFPEEMHRRAIAQYAALHLAPTVTAKRNLVREGVPESRIFITGNTVVDALRYTLTECKPRINWMLPEGQRLIIFTAHRRESVNRIMGMMRALKRTVERYPDTVAVFPMHCNPAVRAAAKEVLGNSSRIRLIEPPDPVSFHHLLEKAYLIMTDSGGIQEEASALGIPTLVMRYSSERPEGMRAGVLRLAGAGEEGIYTLAARLLESGNEEYTAMRCPAAVYGDGHAASRIADAMFKTDLKGRL